MLPRRKVRADKLAGRNRDTGLWRYLVLLIMVGGVFIYFMVKWTKEEDYDRFEKAREYSEYYKEFFVELPITYTVFEEGKLVVRATNRGSEFWNKEFYGMIRQSENEVNEMISVARLINETHVKDGVQYKEEQNLSSFPELFDLLKTGKDLFPNSLYNISSGEISEFWEREIRNYKKKTTAYLKAETVANYLFDNPSLSPLEIQNRKKLLDSLTKEKTEMNSSMDELAGQLKTFSDKSIVQFIENALKKPSSLSENEKKALLLNILKHLQMHASTDVLPKIENVKQFIPYAKPENIELKEKERTAKIISPNTSVDLSFFKEALFLKKLKEKLPKDNFNYLIFLGDRYGMWKLPEKFIRWSVSMDDPFVVTDKVRGAVKLLPEEGFFVVTRKNEGLILVKMDEITNRIQKDLSLIPEHDERNVYMSKLKKEFPSREFFFDPIKFILFKRYDTPVDWRTGSSVDKNLSTLVIDNDPVRARMLSYSLFLSDQNSFVLFERLFPETIFSVLKTDDSVYMPEKWKNAYLSVQDIKRLKAEFDNKSRGLNSDGSVPQKK